MKRSSADTSCMTPMVVAITPSDRCDPARRVGVVYSLLFLMVGSVVMVDPLLLFTTVIVYL